MSKSDFLCLPLAGLWFALAIVSGGQNPDSTGTGLNVHDGFETPGLSPLWSADRFEAGAVTIQTNVVRAGQRAVQITIRPKDEFESGLNGNSDSERDELLEAGKLTAKEGVNYEQSFSMFFPTNFPVVPVRLVIAQWKQYCANGRNCSDDSPVLAVRYIAGELRITQDLDKKYIVLYRAKDEYRGRWLDFKFQVRFSPEENGRIKAWLDDKLLVNYHGVTANPENAATGYPSPGRFYFKMGLYRNVMPESMTVYIDEYRKRELPKEGF